MNHYETLCIIKPTLSDEETAKEIQALKDSIAEQEGKVEATNEIGIRKLAYPINKNERGFYVVVYHTTPAAAIAEIERKLRYNENILRFLTVKYKTKKEITKFQEQVNACNGASQEQEESSSEA